MEDKIEVGEYVRTKDGFIGKVEDVDLDEQEGMNYYICEKDNGMASNYKANIIKHSKNIIKILESEDIVTLEYYVSKFRKRIKRRFEVFRAGNLISFNNIHCDFLYDLNKQKFLDGKGFNPKIKDTVTKEQFNSVKYVIPEEK